MQTARSDWYPTGLFAFHRAQCPPMYSVYLNHRLGGHDALFKPHTKIFCDLFCFLI